VPGDLSKEIWNEAKEKQIKTLHLFRLLSLEMLHRRVEIENQDYKKEGCIPTPLIA